MRYVLFRSVRELLMNVVKHAQASRVRITINRDEDDVSITVSDNGTGFDSDAVSGNNNGFGLFSIRERMKRLGGYCEIKGKPGDGTDVVLAVPLKNPSNHGNEGVQTMNITILLADDHKLMREGLRTLIQEHPGMTVVAESEDGRSAVRLAAELSPKIIIMDISMPGLSGIDATRRLSAANSASKIIALSMHLDRRMILEMLAAGASGYLLKDCAFDKVIHAIRTVASNDRYVSAAITDVVVVRDYVDRASGNGPVSQLGMTERERQILDLVNDGKRRRKSPLSSALIVRHSNPISGTLFSIISYLMSARGTIISPATSR